MIAFFTCLMLANTPATDTLSPRIEARIVQQTQVLSEKTPILQLSDNYLNEQQMAAQLIALADTSLRQFYQEPTTRQPLRTEVFSITPLRPGDFAAVPECTNGMCYRVELYNYAINSSWVSVVDISKKRVQRNFFLRNAQPEIPYNLKELAVHIAIESPEVTKELGFKPTRENALMANTKTALNRTRCERSKHLCVAPTFVKDDRALWVIVDLTDLKIVGLRWTNTGQGITRPTERRVQNDQITECYCEKTNALARNGWNLNYIITSSDGLRISEVDYQGQRVIQDAKLVDWHVSYSNTDGFGYSDGVGCPFFSSSAVVAIEKPREADIIENGKVVGFALVQNYASEGWPTPCNYNYEQRYEFYDDGRFRSAVASLGRGCGNNGTYRPVTRIVFAGQNQRFEEWTPDGWSTWNKETWRQQTATTTYTPEGYQYRLFDQKNKSGYALVANQGQFSDGGRGDNAYVYITRQHTDLDEGDSDLITIGPCCNTDYRQGPERFIEPAAEALNTLDGDQLVFWYVPELRNDDRPGKEYCWAQTDLEAGLFTTKVFPCYSGALFVPLKR
jgi:hypothetical protein